MGVTAVVMVGDVSADLGPVAWVQQARRAAALDLLEMLSLQPQIRQIIVVSPDPAGLELIGSIEYIVSRPGRIHVGRQLAEITKRFSVVRLLYFGGGSAPLLDNSTLERIVNQISDAENCILTNNQYASDWAGIVPASIIEPWQERLPQDNMLGWVLSSEAGLPVKALTPSAASRLDIDTPADLLTLSLHPAVRPHLRKELEVLPLDTTNLEAALQVLATTASHVMLAGRLGPDAWQAVNKVTQCWLRVVSEERGMVSSGRLAREEVFSLLAQHLEVVGTKTFFATLAKEVQAVFIDSRVIMAHHGRWPTESDRFASDLGLVEQIRDPLLREITAESLDIPIPVILGGHGLLSGDLFAFCELL